MRYLQLVCPGGLAHAAQSEPGATRSTQRTGPECTELPKEKWDPAASFRAGRGLWDLQAVYLDNWKIAEQWASNCVNVLQHIFDNWICWGCPTGLCESSSVLSWWGWEWYGSRQDWAGTGTHPLKASPPQSNNPSPGETWMKMAAARPNPFGLKMSGVLGIVNQAFTWCQKHT